MLTGSPRLLEAREEGVAAPLFRTRAELRWLVGLSAAMLLLRLLAFVNYRFDSDEPQHLHVAWGWTANLVQYRDVFDNHAPLFHMASAPILKMIGERDTILFYMRGAMIPLFAFIVLATWFVGVRTWPRRVVAWGAVLLTLFPPFFLKSLEYRTDNLWTALWMATLVLLVGKPLTVARSFWAGFILGCALAVSLKTPLLVVTLIVAALQTDLIMGRGVEWRRAGLRAAAGLAGFVVIPGTLLLLFRHWDALQSLWFCNITFNSLAERGRHGTLILQLVYPLELWLIYEIGRRSLRSRPAPERNRLFLTLLCFVFTVTLVSFWPIISTRDFLPLMPVLFLVLAGALTENRPAPLEQLPAANNALYLLVAVALIEAAFVCEFGTLWRNQTGTKVAELRQVLALTRPGEPIMDLKGETIFRPRPFYYIFETIARSQFRNGVLQDRIAEAVVEKRCYVAQADSKFFPRRGREFLRQNFLDMGRLRAAGQFVGQEGRFQIAIPGPYLVVGEKGPVAGELDGKATAGPRYLEAGPHVFQTGVGQLACVWAPAIERGFSPFHLRDMVR